ncbi:hypothetical protein [Flavobacterium mesophilum]|uniref:hypothetical protein n=1 Tax=Flavobacterium mesophilum TaxID=3143495 RepID=UPI0031D6DF2F
MTKLFEETLEIIKGSAGNNEDSFNYYHKSDRSDIKIIRETLEDWFSKYPKSEKEELKSRFRKDFDAAFFELFLFELFRKQGYEVVIHPQLENSKKRPDFLLFKNDHQIYVEAKVSYDKTEEEMGFERRQNQFYDQLNKVRIKGFLLRIERLNFITSNQPRVKELIELIESEVQKLDPNQITLNMNEFGLDGCPRIEFKNKDFEIVLQPMPMMESKREKVSTTPIGMFPFEFFSGGSQDSLRQSILKKAKRYGKFDAPYLICINNISSKSSGQFDIENVIWGTLQYTFLQNPDNLNARMSRDKDGVFYNSGRPQLTNVSAVLVTGVFPSNIPNAKYFLYQNPFAVNKLNFDDFMMNYNYVEGGQIISNEGDNFDQIFEISKNWLKIP